MQQTSEAYRKSMKSPLRERGYIMITFGLINQEAQAHASVKKGDFAYFSDESTLLIDEAEKPVYATLEENFARVDGSMYFLPREGMKYYNTGITSNDLISNKPFELTLELNIKPTDLKGITIDFGENYPVDFDIIGSTGQTFQYRNNTLELFRCEDVLTNTTSLTIKILRMKNLKSRARIRYVKFGFGLVYYNNDVMSSTLDSYVSPIGADIPQVDFTVKLKNYNKYFDIDNPKSAINFLETGQEMEIYYGYQIPDGEVEWVKGNHLRCANWESDDFSATIRCSDVFRTMDSEYYRGKHSNTPRSYYDLAKEVLAEAGIEGYRIDPHLKKLFTQNPIPKVPCKEALQIIANACRCTLTQTRDGLISIKSNFIPDRTIEATKGTPYSKVQNVLDGQKKDEYATLATNYTVVDGSMFFLPRTINGNVLHTGFISDEMSDSTGNFVTHPKVTIRQEVASIWYGILLEFGSEPAEFIVRTFDNGVKQEEITVTSELISKNMLYNHTFLDFDVMELEFVKTKNPYNRVVLNNFSFGEVTDFHMERIDMMSHPKIIQLEEIKDIIVPYFVYGPGKAEDNIINQEINVTAGSVMTVFLDQATYNYRISSNAQIIDSGDFFVTVKFKTTGKIKLDVWGWRYTITERQVVKKLANRGKTIKWSNPLIGDVNMATELAEWLGDYYSASVEYEYKTRGNPELDASDVIYQQNDYEEDMQVTLYKQTLRFNQSFSSDVKTRRIGGSNVAKS